MFKDFFLNVNRLIYQQGGGAETQKSVEDANQPTPEDFRAEANELNASIDSYAKSIENDLNAYAETGKRIDLKNPKSYEDLPQNLWSVVQSLAEAKRDLEQGGATRVNLDLVRIKVAAAEMFNRSLRLVGDPLAHTAELDVNKVPLASRKTPDKAVVSKENAEAARWVKMAQMVDEYNKLGDTADDKARKGAIQSDLLELASKTMEGKKTMEVNGLQITRAEGPGTEAFKFVMINRARRLEQGGRPGARTVQYTEVPVYAGGSAKDFEKKS